MKPWSLSPHIRLAAVAVVLALGSVAFAGRATGVQSTPKITQAPGPIANSCEDQASLREWKMPRLLGRDYLVTSPEADHDLEALVSGVLTLAKDRIKRDLVFVSNIQHCLGDGLNETRCNELQNLVRQKIPDLVHQVRFHLSVAQSPVSIWSGFGQTDTGPNLKMSTLGTYKLRAWQPTTVDEYKKARDVLRQYASEIVSHYIAEWGVSTYQGTYEQRQQVNDSLLAVRLNHFQQYRSLMAAAPFLQYLTSPSPTEQETLAALDEYSQNAVSEMSYIDQLLGDFAKRSSNGISDELVQGLLGYSSFMEFTLAERPSLCGVASSLIYTFQNRQIVNAVVVGLPLMAASFFTPALIAYPVGVFAAAYFAYDSVQNFQRLQQRFLATLFVDATPDGDQQLNAAQQTAELDFLLVPLSFAGGRIIGTHVRQWMQGKVVTNPRLRDSLELPVWLFKTTAKWARPLK